MGVAWGNICFGFYSAVCFAFSFLLPKIADRYTRRYTHMACLAIGALGLLFVGVAPGKYWLLLSMLGVGIAWASILSMPYAMLACTMRCSCGTQEPHCVPQRSSSFRRDDSSARSASGQ